MTPLVVEVDGRVLRLERDGVIRIGRAIEADVVLSAGSVSRHHAELRPVDGGWLLVDTGSQFGTFVDGRRVTELRIAGRTEVQCGPTAPGSALTILPAAEAKADLDQTQVIARPLLPPAGGPVEAARTGPDLLLVAEGREHRFRHPEAITIGRRADCTVVLEDPAASRLHGEVTAVPGGWLYTNLSSEGTFGAGRRVTRREFDERLDLRLGHPVAGPTLSLVPILSAAEEERRIARRRLLRGLAVAGVAAAVLLLVLGTTFAAVLVLRAGEEGAPAGMPAGSVTTRDPLGTPDELTDAELDAAQAATVKITGRSHELDDPTEEVEYSGSGSVIRSDGLILTNAHVAAPESPGVVDQYGSEAAIADPEYVLVSLTDGTTGTSAAPAYRARVVDADGFLDVAVIQIYADAAGNELTDELQLPAVPLVSSADVRAGDDVTILGFPGLAGPGESITVTTGVISTVLTHPDHGRWEFDTDARIAPGNSGGMAVDNEGRMIGVPTAIVFERESPVVSGRIRAIDVVEPLLEVAGVQVP